ncbi:hypothetical protein ACYOEI_02445 [Singulisphaera rosea]
MAGAAKAGREDKADEDQGCDAVKKSLGGACALYAVGSTFDH